MSKRDDNLILYGGSALAALFLLSSFGIGGGGPGWKLFGGAGKSTTPSTKKKTAKGAASSNAGSGRGTSSKGPTVKGKSGKAPAVIDVDSPRTMTPSQERAFEKKHPELKKPAKRKATP